MKENHVVVIGSLNYDVFLRVGAMPKVGETCPAEGMAVSGGGKGANQAVQCAKLGLRTYMAGAVGNDAMGDFLLSGLREYGVDTSCIRRSDAGSGFSPVHVMPGGKVFGTIYHGANFDISPADVDHLMPFVQDAFALMLQLEIPPETVCYAIRRAHAAGTPVILNAAPACPLPEDVLGLCHTFMANEVEASFYTGTVIETPQQAMDAIRPFCARHGIRAIFTLGAQGAAACDGGQARLIPPVPAQAVESTGAGDSFAGGVVKALHAGRDFFSAASFAAACGAVTVSKVGCQNSMPFLSEMVIILEKL